MNPKWKKPRATQKTATKKVAAAPKTQASAVALIKKVIAREDETKFVSTLRGDTVDSNSSITFADVYSCLPPLYQDAGEGAIYERLGRKVRPISCTYKIELAVTDVPRSTNIVACVWILQSKQVKNFSRLDAANCNVQNNLLLTGASSQVQGFNGYTEDAMLPINSSQYQVLHHVKVPLGKNAGILQDDPTAGNQPVYQGNALRKSLTFKLKPPAQLIYDQDNGSPRTIGYPNNFAPFAVIGYYHANLSPPDTLYQDVTFTSRASMWFDDA